MDIYLGKFVAHFFDFRLPSVYSRHFICLPGVDEVINMTLR